MGLGLPRSGGRGRLFMFTVVRLSSLRPASTISVAETRHARLFGLESRGASSWPAQPLLCTIWQGKWTRPGDMLWCLVPRLSDGDNPHTCTTNTLIAAEHQQQHRRH